MTEQDWIELGRRAVACRGWRWLPGMLTYKPGGIWEWRCHSVAKWFDARGVLTNIPAGAVPDLRDPATVGCLLALVRRAWGMPAIGVHIIDGEAHVIDGPSDDGVWISGDDTEAHALVAALESAP